MQNAKFFFEKSKEKSDELLTKKIGQISEKIKKASEHGEFNIRIRHLDNIVSKYFTELGFKIKNNREEEGYGFYIISWDIEERKITL